MTRRDLRDRESSADGHVPRRRRRLRRRTAVILWIVTAVVVVLVGVGILALLVASKAFAAKDSLESAQSTVSTLQSQASAFDLPGMTASAQTLQQQVADAKAATSDPLYSWASGLPWIGPNLVAVSQITDSIQLVTDKAVIPLTNLASQLSLTSLAPVDGHINMQPIADGQAALTEAQEAITAASAQVSAIDTSGTVSQLGQAKDALGAALPHALETTTKLRTLVDGAWSILGGDGERNYLLVSPNNAEVTALGGGTASMSLLTVDKGAISITDQANSTEFPGEPLGAGIVTLDGNVEAIFPGITRTMNWATSRPDFPTAATIIEAWWKRVKGSTVDGVVSVDPIALGYVLDATGPIQGPDGKELNAQNAATTLLHDVYLPYTTAQVGPATDAYFAATTKAVFEKLLDFRGDPQKLLAAVDKGINNGSVMVHLNDASDQSLIASYPIAGTLPTSNAAASVTGVYFRDVSVSKTDYYLETSAKQTTDACTNPNAPTFTTQITLHSTLTSSEVRSLSDFVRGGNYHGAKFSTEVYVYGPVGARLASTSIDRSTVGDSIRSGASDMGRPVARFVVDLAPGETGIITATFSGSPGQYGTPELRATPMINPTALSVDAPGCH